MNWTSLRDFYQSRSVSVRLYLIIIPTTVFAICAAGYLGDLAAGHLADLSIEKNAVRIANELATTLSADDILEDTEDLRRWMGELVEANDFITRIDVYELTGNAVVRIVTTSSSNTHALTVDEMTSAREARLLLVPQIKDRARFLKVVAPVSVSGGGLGAVAVTSSLHQSDLMGEVHSRVALFLIPVTILLLVPMLHYFFTRVITRRIGNLLVAMTAAKQGDLGRRVLPGANDELGTIALGFNDMMEAFQRASSERDRLLEEQNDFNRQLQSRVAAATQDLTAANERLRQLNQDFLETQRRLTQLERTEVAGQMAAGFAHEIGSPLSAISTHLQLLQEDPLTQDAARARLKLIQAQVERITGFVEEMLVETREATQLRESVQLNTLLRQLLLFLEEHFVRHKLRVETVFDEKLPEVSANARQLQQVFLNLFNNASDAMPDGGTLRVSTGYGSDADGKGFVEVVVSDDGVGIPADKLERIFEPFFSTKDLHHGTGLGLTIAARIIRQHEGTITVESTPGHGTTFAVRLPLSHPPAAGGIGAKEVV